MTNTPTEHHASIGTKNGLTEFRCCEQNERAFAESWDTSDLGSISLPRKPPEPLLGVFNRIAGHLTDHRDDERIQIVVEGGHTQVLLLDDVERAVRMMARYLPGIHLTSTSK